MGWGREDAELRQWAQERAELRHVLALMTPPTTVGEREEALALLAEVLRRPRLT